MKLKSVPCKWKFYLTEDFNYYYYQYFFFKKKFGIKTETSINQNQKHRRDIHKKKKNRNF